MHQLNCWAEINAVDCARLCKGAGAGTQEMRTMCLSPAGLPPVRGFLSRQIVKIRQRQTAVPSPQ